MGAHTEGDWDISPMIRALADADSKVEQIQRELRAIVTGFYKQQAPGRVKGKIAGRSTTRGRRRAVRVFVRDELLGPPVHGRDPGAKAVAYWTEHGTASPITRKTRGPGGKPMPFFFGGTAVASVSGQRAQGWVASARAAGDALAETKWNHLTDDIAVSIDRGMRQ